MFCIIGPLGPWDLWALGTMGPMGQNRSRTKTKQHQNKQNKRNSKPDTKQPQKQNKIKTQQAQTNTSIGLINTKHMEYMHKYAHTYIFEYTMSEFCICLWTFFHFCALPVFVMFCIVFECLINILGAYFTF